MSRLRVWVFLVAALAAGLSEIRAAEAKPEAATTLSAADIRADFKQLYATLQQAHFDLYARVSKADYDRLFAATLADITHAETRDDVAIRFQRFVAFGKIAHARIDANYRAFARYMAGGGKAFPLTIRVVDGKTYITDNRSGLSDIVRGDEITGLNGQPITTWLDRGARNLSADTAYMAHALMELDFPMLLWLELGPQDSFKIAVRHGDGKTANLILPARTSAEMKAAAKAQPPALQLDGTQRIARLMDDRVAYLRPGGFYNTDPNATNEYDNAAFRSFIDSAFGQFQAASAKSVIIDIRDNPGGDSSFSDLMVSWFATKPYKFASAFQIKVSEQAVSSNAKRVALAPGDTKDISHQFAVLYASAKPGDVVAFGIPEAAPRPVPRFTGKVYLLLNRNSYSNAVAVAATVQDYGFGKVIGEETSDLATTYGAMESFTLAKSGLDVGFPKAHIIRPNGDLAARGVVPDIIIKTPVIEGADDPVLKQALAIAAEER